MPKSRARQRLNKERVIHTRVPAVLEEELKRFAENLRVPVSNLIRTILEDALAVADETAYRAERELRSGVARLVNRHQILRRKLARNIQRRVPQR